MSSIPIIAISVGDPNGIGVEVILKTFEDKSLIKRCIPVVYANLDFLQSQQKLYGTKVDIASLKGSPIKETLNVKSIWKIAPKVRFGEQTSDAGAAAFESLKAAAFAVKNKNADVLVTAPINKASIKSSSFPFAGHTHYLGSIWGGNALMILTHKHLRVALLTDHIPISDVTGFIKSELIQKKTLQLKRALIADFDCKAPKIAILGLDPHGGDLGIIGTTDESELKPAIKKLIDQKVNITGPFSADSFFGHRLYSNFDAVLSCYHDQGLVGFKTLTFGEGINVTAGLPFVRTSPDHGTAFDIAGKGIANHKSFKAAVHEACNIYKNRERTI